MKPAHLLLCLALAACATSHPEPQPATDQRVATNIAPLVPVVDSVAVQPHTPALAPAMWMRRALRSFRDNVPQPAQPDKVPRKCKNCSFYYAPATIIGKKATASVGDNARTTVAAKKATQATDSSTVTDQRGATNAVSGHGITATQTNTAPKAPTVGATIANRLTGPLGYVLAAVAVAGAVYGIWWLLPLLPRRKKDDTPTT